MRGRFNANIGSLELYMADDDYKGAATRLKTRGRGRRAIYT